MKNKNSTSSIDSLYSSYRETRDVRPSADLDPMLRAANDALASRSDGTIVDPKLEKFWQEDDASTADSAHDMRAVSLLYREWKSSRVLPNELAEIRERIVTQTVAAAKTRSQMRAESSRESKPGHKSSHSMVAEFFRNAIANVAFAPVAVAASLFAIVTVWAPLGNQTDFDGAELANVSVLGSEELDRSSDLTKWVSAGIDSSFGFSRTISQHGRAFGLGVGSMDLVMALRSGSADKTLEVSRHLVSLSQADELDIIKTPATAVFDEISSHREVSRSVFTRSIHLLTEMKNAFVFEDERALFELGQWVETVYLMSSSSIESGDTASLQQVLRSAKTHFATGAKLKGLSARVSTSLTSLAQIDFDDGVVLAEARLARDISIRIKSLVE